MFGKHLRCIPLVSLCLLGGVLTTSAESDYPEGTYGWYEAGAAVVANAQLNDFFGNPVNANPVSFDTGFHFGLGIGRKVTRFLSLEVMSGFNYNSLNSIAGATASSGNFYRVPLMGNVVLQFPNRSRLVPVIGAGVGAQWVVLDAQNIALGGTTMAGTSDTWVFGYQGYAGVRYEFSDRMSLGLFYQYSVADGPSWTNGSSAGGNFKLDAIRTSSLSLTLGFVF